MDMSPSHVGWKQTKSGTRASRWSGVLHYVLTSGTRTACSYSTPWRITWRDAPTITRKCVTCERMMNPK